MLAGFAGPFIALTVKFNKPVTRFIIPHRLLLLLLLQGMLLHGYAQNGSPQFKRLTTSEGLSQGHVSAILKDSKGFMWFASEEGLNKYDGYRFTVYKYSPENKNSICSNYVFDLLEDNNDNVWVGTAVGLDKYNREKDNFIH